MTRNLVIGLPTTLICLLLQALFLAIVCCDVRAQPMGGQGRAHGLPSVRAPVPASARIGNGPS